MRSVIFQLVIIVVLGVVSVKFRIRLLFCCLPENNFYFTQLGNKNVLLKL
ncbi:hypothetical protein HMPREF1173_01616 [Prevotella nigrescens CC14M]|uniref:Uncharacterized protein n=1 Tax=Prevotella nigrescens CC14M TaxID=1073366 RepID=V8CMN5_9BACT|nr:hypothetical protein HMPREF1173_01616 [Prevotella nigrescens CC14M]